ncbi:molybdenum cofactor guanylyltransferase [Sphingobacterium olei]|uniref:Molybdenum cofactor guanylyltransferase n=1 Tax=Sphingobacterium olei TaxID=2571155 RepID=A0A4U0P6T5_9SPHI|nr:molybdenum cofactor guanylyltransferase [Sphingobacterium olei]TJZ63181.1 molybdenum cofactor guanylyltransferase [Sphingobacterium olei]
MMIGLVLCGGESKRMGTDKGMLRHGNYTWAEYAQQTLHGLDLPVFISVNEGQLPVYQQRFSNPELIVDCVFAKGPLAGLLSLHFNFPEHDILVLACDMINMDAHTLHTLIRNYGEDEGVKGCFFGNNGRVEPLCAIYSSDMLTQIAEQLDSGQLVHFALHKIISYFHVSIVPIADHVKFANYNTFDHLRK